MVYPYVISVRRGTPITWPILAGIQIRDSSLSLIHEYSVPNTHYSHNPFAVDSRGHSFLINPNSYLIHYDNEGNFLDDQAFGSNRNSYGTQIAKNGYLLCNIYKTNTYITEIEGHARNVTCSDVVPMTRTLTSMKAHQRLAVDLSDSDIYYAFNTTDNVIEKWSISGGIQSSHALTIYTDFEQKGSGMECIGAYIYAPYMRVIDSHMAGVIWKMSTELTADPTDVFTIAPDGVTEGDYIIVSNIKTGRTPDNNLLVTFEATSYNEEDVLVKAKHFYIRIYDTSGNQVGSTADVGYSGTGQYDLTSVTPCSSFDTTAVDILPEVETIKPVDVYVATTKLYGTWKLNLIDSKNTYEIGWYYNVECLETMTAWKIYIYDNPIFTIEGQYEKLNNLTNIPEGYFLKAYARNCIGEALGDCKKFELAQATITTLKAEKTAGHLYLYGEITEKNSNIIERGFEYLVQDEEPGEEDTGTEVKETGEFEAEEYHLSSWDTYEDLYRAAENTIWWFRAYAKDDEDNKYTAASWMKNVPTVITSECTEVEAQQAKGNGELTDKGASESVTGRGFRIIKEYVGDLFGASAYIFHGFEGRAEMTEVYGTDGILTGFIWTGILHRDSLEEGDFDLEIYDRILGGGFLGEGFGLYLKPNDIYKIQAIAVNGLGMGFGEEVDLVTTSLIDPSDDEIVSEISAEKTITLGTIPDGCTVTRIGIRLGRTQGCTDMHVYEDGSWGSGESHTFYITGFVPGTTYYKMPYIILNHGDYEEEIKAIPDYRDPERLEEWLEDYPVEVFPDVEDEDDLNQTVVDASVGDISYRTIIKEIKCEKIGEQSFIDMYGRRRSQTISNHLIQTREKCIEIIDEYIERFQILKLKAEIDYDIPIPFEREDVILLGDGKEKYKADGEGIITLKADGEGTTLQEDFILAKIRKINSRFVSGTETILNLELEV